jgi:hypothetical protein
MKQSKHNVTAPAAHLKTKQQSSLSPRATGAPAKTPPVAPPAFRPQQLPAVLQRKSPAQRKESPQVSRPQPVAPPVYSPNQTPRVLQPKIGAGQAPQINRANPFVVQLAARKWLFKEVRNFVSTTPPQPNEDANTYADRLALLATTADPATLLKIREEAAKAHALANPAPKVKPKKKEQEGPHPGWTVDKEREVYKNYEISSGGGSHRPKGMVWIDDEGFAWSEDKDEHAGAGYKKFQRVRNAWQYIGTYNMDLTPKNR